MKEKTKKSFFKSVLSIALAIVLFLGVALVFAGCDEDDEFYDPENPSASPSFFERYVGGFNTVFANDTSGYGGIDDSEARTWSTRNFNTYFLQQISAYFGDGNLDSLPSENPKLAGDIVFPDSIRFYAYEKTENGNKTVAFEDVHWNWFISPKETPTVEGLQNDLSDDDDGFEKLEEWSGAVTEAFDYLSATYSSLLYNYLFRNILQIVIYEIMLGYDNLTEISVSYGTKDNAYTYTFKVEFSNSAEVLNWSGYVLSGELDEISPPDPPIQEEKLENYASALQAQYENQTRYTGFTKDNADRLIDYILDEVIGETAVTEDYNKFIREEINKENPINYRNYVDTIVKIVYGLTYDGSGDVWVYDYEPITNYSVTFEGRDAYGEIISETSFAAKPATYVRYFPGETLFGEDDVDYQFSNKPIGEYQSILVVPARTITTLLEGGIRLEAGFVFNFMSYNKDLKINAKVRYQYYNEITGYRKLFEFDCDQINFDDGYEGVDPDGRTYWENDFELSIETDELPQEAVITEKDSTGYEVTYYTIGFFNNDSLLDAVAGAEGGEVTLTEFEAIQDLYKVISSENGYGGITVLNEKKINSSFFEIVLDVVKTPNDPPDTDYNFRLVLSNTLLSPGIY